MMTIFEKVKDYIRKNHMIAEGDLVLAGVSGGADSVCLFYLLKELRQEFGFALKVVHVEHGIRGEDSKKDAQYVESLCRKNQVECVVRSVNVPSLAEEWKMGEEEAARKARYEIFAAEKTREEQKVENAGNVKIAVAHHKNDQAETVLFQMVRGSGFEGLSGISPVSGNIIRPLLCLCREEVEAYLEEIGVVDYCIDATNENTAYARNRIRHEVLPELTKINAQAVAHIAEEADLLSEAADFIRSEAGKLYSSCVEQENEIISIKIKELQKQHPFLQKELVKRALYEAAGAKKDLGRVQIEQILNLQNLQSGRKIDLPYEIEARKEYDRILLLKKSPANSPAFLSGEEGEIFISPDRIPGELTAYGCHFRFSFADAYPEGEEGKKKFTKYLNYDKMKCGFSLRTARPGDYLIVDADGSRQKLSRYFINRKIPQEKRIRIPLLAIEDEVLWLIGERMSEHVKIDASTKQILCVEVDKADTACEN